MRMVDALMALPALLLAMLLLTTVGANPVYVALGIARRLHAADRRAWCGASPSASAAAEFIDAARAPRRARAYIIFAEMLPNAWAPIIVES